MSHDTRFIAGADALTGFLVQTLAPEIGKAILTAARAWKQSLGPAPLDIGAAFDAQDAERERRRAQRQLELDAPFIDDLSRGNVGGGE